MKRFQAASVAAPTGSAGARPTRLGVNPKSALDRHERKVYRRPSRRRPVGLMIV